MKVQNLFRRILNQRNYLYIRYLICTLRYIKTPKNESLARKRGFYLKVYNQDTNPEASGHDLQHNFSFSSQEEQFDAFYARFFGGYLGKIFMTVLWDELVGTFGLRESQKGPSAIFSPKGKLALMFLTNYSGFSDRKLLELPAAPYQHQAAAGGGGLAP